MYKRAISDLQTMFHKKLRFYERSPAVPYISFWLTA